MAPGLRVAGASRHRGLRAQLVLVSAGFDAHVRDPLSATEVSESTYGHFTEQLLQATGSTAQGRMVSVLEGGYDLEGLAASAEVHVKSLLDAPQS